MQCNIYIYIYSYKYIKLLKHVLVKAFFWFVLGMGLTVYFDSVNELKAVLKNGKSVQLYDGMALCE